MRGFLRNGDFVYPFQSKVTTVGRDGSDIVVQGNHVDVRHALIECLDDESFVLKDLESTQGTFVNDCRIHGAAIRLASGDKIRFGYVGPTYEFLVDSGGQSSIPPMAGATRTWSPGLMLINEPAFTTGAAATHGLPTIALPIGPGLIPSHNPSPSSALPRPPNSARPPSAISRPMSAGSARRQANGGPFQSPVPPPQPASREPVGGWMSGSGRTPGAPSHSAPTADIQLLQEKEQKILALQAEVTRLQAVELDAAQKDQAAENMKVMCKQLEDRLASLTDPDLRNKMVKMEQELAAKHVEVGQLRDRLSQSSVALSTAGASGSEANLRMELTSSQAGAAHIRTELDRARKDKQITSGLVTQLQRDMANKDSTISRLTREIEALKREVKEKEITVSAIQAKFSRIKDSKKAEEEREMREKDMLVLRQKLKLMETRAADMEITVRKVQSELDGAKAVETQHLTKIRALERELEDAKNLTSDVQRSERLTRVDLQEASKKYERFRNRVMQVAFSTPGIRAPDDEIKDDQLIEMLRKVIDERTEFHKKIMELKDNLKLATNSKKEVTDCVKKLKTSLSSSMSRLARNRCASVMRDEVNVLLTEPVDPLLQPIKEVLSHDLQQQAKWLQEIENALEKCGVNIKLSSETPAAHIRSLLAKWEGSVTERDRIKARLASLETNHKAELEALANRFNGDAESRVTLAVERAKLQAAEEMRQAVDNVTRSEAEKREAALQVERDRISELNDCIAQLQKSLVERQSEHSDRLQEAEQALSRLAECEALISQLQENLQAADASKAAALSAANEDRQQLEGRHRDEVAALEERLKQASVGSSTTEERLQKASRKAEDLQKEVTRLKKENSELRNRPSPKREPKEPARIIVQKPSSSELAALEKAVQTLKTEKKDMETQISQNEAVISELKKELAAAAARLSDARSEMSNAAKEELSRQRLKAQELEQKIWSLKQDLRQVTDQAEKHKAEVAVKENENRQERSKVTKLTNTVGEKEEEIRRLEGSLADERARMMRELASKEDEGRIRNELTAMGAACRGERHSDIISHQKEALSEMRQRLKQLEQLRPAFSPTNDQAVQQVAVLKKEMAEMRARQAIAANNATAASALPSPAMGGENGEVDERRKAINASEISQERSAHKETQMALEVSETTYMSLLRAMASNLDLESVQGLRSVTHLPHDERQRLAEEREKATSLMSQRIRVLKERLTRKEELLRSYEQDLARLKQAEELASRKHAQVETLVKDFREKAEESELLRESLSKTKDELNQEKRLNTAIKQKKTFYLERPGSKSPTKKSHSCVPDDREAKVQARSRIAKENAKRRDYEIHTLKSQLASRERDLCKASSRLVNLETTMGLNAMDEFPE